MCIILLIVSWNYCTSKLIYLCLHVLFSFVEEASCGLISLHLLAILALNGCVDYVQYTSNLLSSVDERI